MLQVIKILWLSPKEDTLAITMLILVAVSEGPPEDKRYVHQNCFVLQLIIALDPLIDVDCEGYGADR